MGEKKNIANKLILDNSQEMLDLLNETGRIGAVIAYMGLLEYTSQLSRTLPIEDIITALAIMAKHDHTYLDKMKG